MPQVTTCPECEKKLKVPDNLIGRMVRCPGCSKMFKAEADADEAEAPPRSSSRKDAVQERPEPRRRDREEDEEDDRRRASKRDEDDDEEDDRPRRRRERDEDDDYRPRKRHREEEVRPRPGEIKRAWARVRSGLHFVLMGDWILVISSVLYVLTACFCICFGFLFIASAAADRSTPPNAMANRLGAVAFIGMIIQGAFVLAGLIGLVLQCVGMGMCMVTPTRKGATGRVLAIAAFACYVMSTFGGALLAILSVVAAGGLRGSPGTLGLLLLGTTGLTSLCGGAAPVLWFVYLRIVCIQLNDDELKGKATLNLILWVLYWFAFVFLYVLMTAILGLTVLVPESGARFDPKGANLASTLIGGLLFLCGIGLYLWYLQILRDIRDLVESRS